MTTTMQQQTSPAAEGPPGAAAAAPLAYAAPPAPPLAPAPLRSLWENAGMVVVFLLMFLAASIFVDHFFSWTNLKGLLLSVTTIGMVACTMLFCLAAGDFDLSVGSVLAMAGITGAVVSNATDSAVAGILAGVAAGALVGFVNGFVIAQLGINALITTLATMQVARGLAYLIAPGAVSVGIRSKPFHQLGKWSDPVLHISSPIWLLILSFLVFGVLLRYTTFGRNTLAIGGNAEAARLAGIRVRRTKIVIFTLQGAMAAFAGVVLAARLTSGQPNNGQGLELQVISACVLGGVSLTGGIGTMVGVVVGVLIMGMVENVMRLMNVPTFYQYIASGTILLVAVLIDRARTRGSV
jgi:L-arabinose transport system permease protein